MFSPSIYLELKKSILEATELNLQQVSHLDQLKAKRLKHEENLLRQKQEQDELSQKISALELLVLNSSDKINTHEKKIATLQATQLKSTIFDLEAEIEKLQAENRELAKLIKPGWVEKELSPIKLKRIHLQEEQEQIQDEVARLAKELELANADCLSLEVLIKNTKSEKKQLEDQILSCVTKLPLIQENLIMLPLMELNVEELRYLLMIARNKDFEAFLHWHLGWLAYFTQDLFMAGNHLYIAMFYQPEIYKTQKLDEIEHLLRDKNLWFEDGRQNYDHYLTRKYSDELVSIEELIFWANRVIFTNASSEVDYEMFSDLLEYSARQNDWHMVDGVYTALSILSATRPLYLSHLNGIVQPICDFVKDLFSHAQPDYLYLFYLPKMLGSKVYQEHIKPKNLDFWLAEQAKLVDYHPGSALSAQETVVCRLHEMMSTPLTSEYDAHCIPKLITPTLPFILRAWVVFAWAQRLNEQGKTLDAHFALDHAIHIYSNFKEALALKKNLSTGFSLMFFPKPKPTNVGESKVLLNLKKG